MAVRIVRLGTPRLHAEGTRIGTVRRPPRDVSKERYASDNWFDVWYPDLAPSLPLMSRAKSAATATTWNGVARSFRAEMNAPTPRRTLDLLAILSHNAHFSIVIAPTKPDAIAPAQPSRRSGSDDPLAQR
jgi:uncharacterized protein YeaO (DUF488 family)